MEADDYSIRLEQVDFRTCALVYKRSDLCLLVYVEQSAVPEFDWVGLDDDFRHWTTPRLDISEEERKLILSRVEQWSAQNGVKIYIGSHADWGK
jgi:hypothetical protein